MSPTARVDGPTPTSQNPYRLPRDVIPSRYDLTLSPDLARRDFVGEVRIALDVREATNTIVCNAKELTITKAWAVGADGVRLDALSTAIDESTERLTIALPSRLAVGAAQLHVQFTGILNDKLAGFYASTWTDESGNDKVIATTQFEATDARRAFPCWDEPDLKAVFGITLVVEHDLFVVSNSPELSSQTLASGRRSVHFADTPVMSTYLVCFVVGDLEATAPVDAGGVPVRVIHRAGQGHLTQFGIDCAVFSLRHFTEYYGIPYPGQKYDLIALPDFAAGAMENLGAVTFREQILLVDADNASLTDLERAAQVVAHETAHMWFGDLVTMKWWNGLWLNEAFATFMEVHCVSAWKPEWDRWTAFAIDRSRALDIDALHETRPIEYPVVSPHDADGMFDVLTYEKGGSVLRMLEQHLGEDVFRDGVRAYLHKHAYANAETTDLFDSLEEVSGVGVREMMDGWIFAGGYPLVHAKAVSEQEVELTQERFCYLSGAPARSWQVPVMLRADSGDTRVLLGDAPVRVRASGAVVVNAGGHGFYRVAYDDALLARLGPVVAGLAPVERYGIVSDTWAAVSAGARPAPAFLDLIAPLRDERDPNVWSAIAAGCTGLDQVCGEQDRELLRTRLVALAGPAAAALGWQAAANEPDTVGATRAAVLSLVGITGAHAPTVEHARALVERVLNEDPTVDGDVAPAVLAIAAAHGDAALYDRFLAARDAVKAPQLVQRIQFALATFPDPALVDRTGALCLATFRSQDSAYVLGRALAHRLNGERAWAFISTHWDEIVARVPANSVMRMCEGLAWRSEPQLVAASRAFFSPGAGHDLAVGQKSLLQHLERQQVSVALRARVAADGIG